MSSVAPHLAALWAKKRGTAGKGCRECQPPILLTDEIKPPPALIRAGLAALPAIARCDEHRLKLHEIEALTVAVYIEQLGNQASKPTVKQHLAAIRQLCDYLTNGGILEVNPAASVRGPKYVVKRGKTPVLSAEEARKLLDSIESNTLIDIRDLALIGTMVIALHGSERP